MSLRNLRLTDLSSLLKSYLHKNWRTQISDVASTAEPPKICKFFKLILLSVHKGDSKLTVVKIGSRFRHFSDFQN
jgi:hypothetical protein